MEKQNMPGKPWPAGFPKVMTLANYKAFKSHPDYEAAKGGNTNAATRLIQALVGNNTNGQLIALAEKYPDAILVSVHAIEATGKNEIPHALAEYISTQNEQNSIVALSENTKLDLERVFGVKSADGSYDMTLLRDFLKESGIYGGNYEALTESESKALLHSKGLDEARNRRVKARQTGNEQVLRRGF